MKILDKIKLDLGWKKKYYEEYEQKFEKYLLGLDKTNISKKSENNNSKNIGVLISPWCCTFIPWFFMSIALMYRQNGYNNVFLIYDDLWEDFENPLDPFYDKEALVIEKILKRMSAYFDIIFLSAITSEFLDEQDDAIIEKGANLNTIKGLYSSIKDNRFNKRYERLYELCNKVLPYIKGVCKDREWDTIIIPGGIYQDSGLFFETCKRYNIDVITYDGRSLGINCVAAQSKNSDISLGYITKQNIEPVILRVVDKLFEDKIKAQREDKSNNEKSKIVCKIQTSLVIDKEYDVLMLMNLEHDSAALGTHNVFENDSEQLIETVNFILNETTYTIAVRQHPAEIMFNPLGHNLQKVFSTIDNDRFTFIPCYEKVNTYDLIIKSRAVVVNTSTVGLETILLGKKIISESNSYYCEEIFVKKAISKEIYFQYILEEVINPSIPTYLDQCRAKFYWFSSQCANRFMADFGEAQNTFKNIPEYKTDPISKEEEKLLIKCLIEKKPLPLLRDYSSEGYFMQQLHV